MRTFVSAIGYNTTSVTRPLLRYGLDSGDRVVLLRPQEESDDARAAEAIEDVDRLLSEIEPAVTLETERVSHDEFERTLLAVSALLADVEGDLVVNLGGGARDVLLPLAIAAVRHAPSIDRTLSFSDVDGSVRELTLPRLSEIADGPETETLSAIVAADGPTSVPELTDSLPVTKSTVGRHVDALEAAGQVRSWSDGKTKVVESTVTGTLAEHG